MLEVFRFQDQAQPWGKKVLTKSPWNFQIPVFQEFCAPVLEVKVCWSKARLLALYQRQSCLCHICWRWTYVGSSSKQEEKPKNSIISSFLYLGNGSVRREYKWLLLVLGGSHFFYCFGENCQFWFSHNILRIKLDFFKKISKEPAKVSNFWKNKFIGCLSASSHKFNTN